MTYVFVDLCTLVVPCLYTYKYHKGTSVLNRWQVDMRSENHQAKNVLAWGSSCFWMAFMRVVMANKNTRPHESQVIIPQYIKTNEASWICRTYGYNYTVNLTYSQSIYHVWIMPTICHILKYNQHEGTFPYSRTHIYNLLGQCVQTHTLYMYRYVYGTVYLHLYV